MQRQGWLVPLALVLFLAFALADCGSATPAFPVAAAAQGQRYTRPDIGFTLDVPVDFQSEQIGPDTVFRYGGTPVLRVLVVDGTAAHSRELWGNSQPLGRAQVAGQAALVYAYDNQNLFTSTRALAYVLPYGEKQIGIEFRTTIDSLDAYQQHILDSFRLAQ